MVKDINGKEIKIGSYVRYINTGTIGTVVDIIEKDGKIWVLLDNDLMYLSDTLEVIEDIKKYKKEEIDEEKIKEMMDEESLTNIDLDSDACGAG